MVPVKEWPPDDMMRNIAMENAVAETAFFIKQDQKIQLRWFTPEIEMDLCGHATLATAHCLKTILNHQPDLMVFETKSGELSVLAEGEYLSMNFPSWMPVKAEFPEILRDSLNIQPQEVYKSRDYILIYQSESEIRDIQINRQLFDQINLDPGGVIVTAAGTSVDFVSRFFTPQASILEDPVTGSAHSSLIPFWSTRLNREEMVALQLSSRGGRLVCANKGDRVIIKGQAKTYSIGTLWIA